MNIYWELITQFVDDSQAVSLVFALVVFFSPLCRVNNVMIWKNNSTKGILSWVYTKRWVWCLWCKQACVQLQNTAGTENNKGSKQRCNQTAAQARIPPNREIGPLTLATTAGKKIIMRNKSWDSHQKFPYHKHRSAMQTASRWVIAFCLSV